MSEETQYSSAHTPPIKQLIEEREVIEELLDEIDLEIWAKEGKHPRKAKRYRIKIDVTYYIVHKHEIDGRELLTLAKKIPPAAFILTQKIRGQGVKTIQLDEVVDLSAKGVERFTTLPRQVQEGSRT
jgi:hypothetical protein